MVAFRVIFPKGFKRGHVAALVIVLALFGCARVMAQTDPCDGARGDERAACLQRIQMDLCGRQTGSERMKCQSAYTPQRCANTPFPARCNAMASAHVKCSNHTGDSYVRCVNDAARY
jgi:hypothetical protein